MIYLFLFTLLSTRFWIFSRMALYFMMPAIFFIPNISDAFVKKDRSIISIAIGSLFLCYMIALLVHGDGNYYPYKTLWSYMDVTV